MDPSLIRYFYILFSICIFYGVIGVAMMTVGPDQMYSLWTLCMSYFMIISATSAIFSLRRLSRKQAGVKPGP